ncbi:receptor-transporting protein 4 [Manis pentadactyla]|uniref:receptor-transporting protein 4 n=1 Tax=Manis pentadactyla TaxID=143292 RepID=UPI00255C5D01|nr:receptor-transporting protein 4 [Manis pentadactyla]
MGFQPRPQRNKMVLDVGTWEQIFQELIQEVKPRTKWTLRLEENLQLDRVAQGWKQYQQRAFGRFQCSSCQRRWASARVIILCHMHLERRKSQGQVLMRHFAQRCQKCSKCPFEKPDFSPESTMRILNNLVSRIVDRCYEDSIKKVRELPVIPEVPLEGSHDIANCEACFLGFCTWGFQNWTEPSNSPLSYMDIGSSLPPISQSQAKNQSAEAKEAQGNGYPYVLKRSGPSHTTARIQVSGTVPQPKQELGQKPTLGDQQATPGTGPQAIQVAGSPLPGWTDQQPKLTASPLVTRRANSQSTHSATAARGSATTRVPQAAWGRRERCSPRCPGPDSFPKYSPSGTPNSSLGQESVFRLGCICAVALFSFIVTKFL